MFKKLVFIFIFWRLLLWIPLIISPLLLPFRQGYKYTLLPYFTTTANPINHYLFFPWGNFDGIYYLLIAAKGYTINAGFFPLFPLLIHLASTPFGQVLPFEPIQYALANLLVTIFTLGAALGLAKLLRLDYAERTVTVSVLMLLAFPTAFFLATIYSEGLFLLLAVSSFYFARNRRWFWASLLAALLTASRPVGIAIIPALLWEFVVLEKLRLKHWLNILSRGWALSLTPLGIVGYAWYNLVRWGNPLYFIQAQGSFANNRSVNTLVFFPQTLLRYAKILLTLPKTQYEWWIALFELATFIFATGLFYLAWKKKVRTSYLVFALLAFLMPVSTGTFSGLPRYVLVLFPLFTALALVKHKWVKLIYLASGIIFETIFLVLFSRGYYLA